MTVSGGSGRSARLAVIGNCSLSLAGVDCALPSRKARSILAYLALTPPGICQRATLAELFWPGADPDLARSSLRQALSLLNKALSAQGFVLLDTSVSAIGLRPGQLETDLDALKARLAAGNLSEGDCRLIEALPQQLLADFDDAGPQLEEWLRTTRQRCVAEIQAQLVRSLSDEALPHPLRLRLARAGLVLDEFDETAARAVMSCLVEAGNAAAALRFYGTFYERLSAELDAEPSIETQDLAVWIKQMQPAPGAPPLRAVPALAPVQRNGALVAVLPFETLGPEPLPGYLSLGMLDQITCHLATFRAPAVISSNSTRGFLGQRPSIAEVRSTLNADYVVSGSVLLRGTQARLAVQMADAQSGVVLWAQTFPASAETLFDIQGTIAEQVVNALVPSVELAELRRVEHHGVESLEPYHLVLRARELVLRLDRAAMDSAATLMDEAERKDPGFGPLHALRAEWYALRLWQGWSPAPDSDRQALEGHALRAIAALPGSGRSMALLAHCRTVFRHDHAEALRLFDKALTICPNDAETLAWTVPTLSFCDQTDKAIAHGEKAIALSPLDPFLFRNEHFLSIALYAAGSVERAAELGLSVLARAPDYSSNLRLTIAALEASGRRAEAAPLVARHNRLHPDFQVGTFLPRVGFQSRELSRGFARQLIAAGLSA